MTMLIRQHCDKDRGALWMPCDVPGHALWHRQLVGKRSVWYPTHAGALVGRAHTGIVNLTKIPNRRLSSEPKGASLEG